MCYLGASLAQYRDALAGGGRWLVAYGKAGTGRQGRGNDALSRWDDGRGSATMKRSTAMVTAFVPCSAPAAVIRLKVTPIDVVIAIHDTRRSLFPGSGLRLADEDNGALKRCRFGNRNGMFLFAVRASRCRCRLSRSMSPASGLLRFEEDARAARAPAGVDDGDGGEAGARGVPVGGAAVGGTGDRGAVDVPDEGRQAVADFEE